MRLPYRPAACLALATFGGGCVTEFRPVSPLALPAITRISAQTGSAPAVDLEDGTTFLVRRGFDAEIVPVDTKKNDPRALVGPIRSGFSQGQLLVQGRDDRAPFAIHAGEVKWVRVAAPSPTKTAVVSGVLGGLTALVVTTAVIFVLSQQRTVIDNAD